MIVSYTVLTFLRSPIKNKGEVPAVHDGVHDELTRSMSELQLARDRVSASC